MAARASISACIPLRERAPSENRARMTELGRKGLGTEGSRGRLLRDCIQPKGPKGSQGLAGGVASTCTRKPKARDSRDSPESRPHSLRVLDDAERGRARFSSPTAQACRVWLSVASRSLALNSRDTRATAVTLCSGNLREARWLGATRDSGEEGAEQARLSVASR